MKSEETMTTYTFDQLTELLPKCEAFPTAQQLPHGVTYGSMIPEFTSPDVALAEGDLHKSQVLIIAAPGAVGKSTLARALSSKNRALIWDLAKAEEVGFGSLDAMLERAMQQGLKSDFLEWMSEGIQFIIVDALDEGRIKVNENSFFRLLENISLLAKDAKGICFVLLGRTQIAESVWLSLTDQDIDASILTIEPFTRQQANEYIEKRTKRDFTVPFVECRDLIFQQLEAPMKDGPDSETTNEFLHYPPVLDVISVLLNREGNLMALKNFLESQTPETAVKLLHDVMNHILEREQQEKFIPAFSGKLAEKDRQRVPAISDSLYTKDEQGKRLLASVLDASTDCTPAVLPVQLEAEYISAVKESLIDHPFLRGENRFANSVFQSYLYARALRGDFGDDLSSRVTGLLSESTSLPTTLLAEFYLGTGINGISSQQQVKPEHVGLLYDSLLSSASSRRRVRLSIEGSDPLNSDGAVTDEAEGAFELLSIEREDDSEYEPQSISFSLNAASDSLISFRRYIGDVNLTIPCTVVLGAGVAEFKIGPSVYINANRIRIASEALVVEKVPPKYCEYADTGVRLEAQAFESPLLRGSPTVYAQDFSVSWPGDQAFPWRRYRSDQVPSDFDDAMSHRAYLRFRRIATAFQSRGKGSLARAKVKIEHPRIMRSGLEQSLLKKLLEDGILYLGDGGRRYFWEPERADDLLGVSWLDLRKGECPQRLRHYLSEFIRLNPEL